MLIDTHCHLDFPEFDADRSLVVAQAQEEGVGFIINIGSSITGSVNSVNLAGEFENVFAVIGCHPHDAAGFRPQDLATLRSLAASKKVKAIGEIGLDYYRNLSPQKDQQELFVQLIRLARELALPVVIHSRQAEEDSLAILRQEKVTRGIVHCFGGSERFLHQCLDAGLYVSFTCNITYKKAEGLRDIVRMVPSDRFCLETDAPYLAPEGYRGKRNEPKFVRMLAEAVAKIRGISPEEVGAFTTQNAKIFFGL